MTEHSVENVVSLDINGTDLARHIVGPVTLDAGERFVRQSVRVDGGGEAEARLEMADAPEGPWTLVPWQASVRFGPADGPGLPPTAERIPDDLWQRIMDTMQAAEERALFGSAAEPVLCAPELNAEETVPGRAEPLPADGPRAIRLRRE